MDWALDNEAQIRTAGRDFLLRLLGNSDDAFQFLALATRYQHMVKDWPSAGSRCHTERRSALCLCKPASRRCYRLGHLTEADKPNEDYTACLDRAVEIMEEKLAEAIHAELRARSRITPIKRRMWHIEDPALSTWDKDILL